MKILLKTTYKTNQQGKDNTISMNESLFEINEPPTLPIKKLSVFQMPVFYILRNKIKNYLFKCWIIMKIFYTELNLIK